MSLRYVTPPGHAALDAADHEGISSGGPETTSQATEIPARLAQESPPSEGMTRLLPPVESDGQVTYVDTEKCRTLSGRVRLFGGGLGGGEVGVWTVSTLWVADWAVAVPDWAGFRMFWRESSACKGWILVRVPPRAQCFRRSGAFFVFLRVHIVHTPASDLIFRVCGVPERPIWLCGGAADYGGPGTALRGFFWVFILVRPSVGFSRSLLHGGQGRLRHDLLIIL